MSTKIVIPSLGLTMEEATVIQWLKQEGDVVEKDEAILVIETDKATAEVPSPENGILGGIIANAGDVVPVGKPVAFVYTKEEYFFGREGAAEQTVRRPVDFYQLQQDEVIDLNINTTSKITSTNHTVQETEEFRLKVSPAARKLARERGVDLSLLQGSGPGGRIIENDVKNYRTEPSQIHSCNEPLSPMRKIISQRMLHSAQTTAAVTLFSQFRMDEVVKLRHQMNKTLDIKNKTKITYNAVFIRALALALGEFPIMQAQWGDNSLKFQTNIHIGLAVALPTGLVVPVVRNAQSQSLFSIALKVDSLVLRARQNQLSPDDLKGSTFTLTNLGMHSVNSFTPIINSPECAILGLGAIRDQPVVENGSIVIGKTAEISLTFDHRIVDGTPAAQFLDRLKSLIEEPYQLFYGI